MHLRVIGVTFNILTNAVKINDIKCDSPFCVLTTAVLRITTAVKVPRMLFMVATALMLLHILLLFYLKNGTIHKTTTSSLPTLHGMFRVPPP